MTQIWKAAATAVALAAPGSGPALAQGAMAEMRNAEDQVVANVSITEDNGTLRISVEARDLPPGFHGFHIHAVGACEPPDFESAEGHFNPDDVDHPGHAGDLPNLLVMEDGTAMMLVASDRMTVADLLEGDGTAFIIHANRDNHAHIPERYADEPDEETMATGDAGDRLACGVLTG